MTISSSTIEPRSAFSLAEQRLLDEFGRLIVPFAQAAATSVAYCGAQTTAWLTNECQCSRQNTMAPACVNNPVSPERDCRALSCGTGQMLVCAPTSQAAALALAVEHLIATLERQLAMEQQEEMLLDELSASWESLEAVYDVSSDLGLLTNPQELLARIVYRAASYRVGLKAVLWLERDGIGYPLAHGVEGLSPRPVTDGLLGQVLTERNGLIINDRERIAAQPGLEMELAEAANLAVVPLTTRQNTLGLLMVWQQESNGDFDSHDTRFLSALALQAAMVVENDRLHRAELESERLRQEVEIGSRIQQMLLQGKIPSGFDGLQVAALSVPSRMIDGDFYDFIRPHKDCLDIIIGDVMGKGIPAALVGAATKSAFLRAMNQLWAVEAQRLPEPYEIVASVHEDVVNRLIRLESFVTLSYARFDMATQQVRIVDCGHTAAVRYRPSTNSCDLLKGINLPIGFIEDEVYEQSVYPLEAGDLFFFYSDGLTEATNSDGEAFGEDRLLEMLQRNASLEIEKLIAEVRHSLMAFTGREMLGDDLTCVAARVLPREITISSLPAELRILSNPQNLTLCRDFVRRACLTARPESSEEFITQLELAVNEAIANVMEHSYQEREDEPVQILALTEDERMVFRIQHQGLSFDPASVPEPSFDGSKDGGFGLFIIAHLVDEIVYDTDAQGHHIISLSKLFVEE